MPIIVDSSALVALLLGEPEGDLMLAAILQAEERWISAFSLLETEIVIAAKKGDPGRATLDALVHHLDLQTIPFTVEHVQLALEGWLRFGKGRHPAAFNLGDCCAYALARASGSPLLAKGADFPQTDVELVDFAQH
jgi:ribonuclease VapC